MKRKFRLTRSTDFERVRRNGKSYAHPLVVLVAAQNQIKCTRVGIVAGKSVGCAVHRNRAKRLIRSVIHEMLPCIKPGWDLIFYSRKSLYQATIGEIDHAIRVLLSKSGLLVEYGGNVGRSVPG